MSQTAASNYPAGSDSPATLDDTQRAHGAFIAQLRDGKGFTNPVTLASATTTDIGGQNSQFVEISGTTTITSFGTTYNGPRYLRFTGALLLTYNATTLILPTAANITTVAGDTAIAIPNAALNGWNVIAYQRANGTPLSIAGSVAAAGANSDITSLSGLTTALSTAQGGSGNKTGPAPRSYLAGLTLSTAGSSATMSIAAGACTDSANADLLTLSSIAKTTSAWAVGTATGGLDTGAIANSTWYHFYVIRRPDTGVVDVVFSTNATSPTLPTNYTQYRRIGSGRTNGSAQWTSFTQVGDAFYLAASVLDVNAGASSASATLNTLTVPLGVQTVAIFNGMVNGNATNNQCYFSSPSQNDEAPSLTATPLFNQQAYNVGNASFASNYQILTNTSSQIRRRELAANATTISIATLGWIDSRGRNA